MFQFACCLNAAEDGKFVGDSEVGEFWSLFGGYAPIPRESPSFFQDKSDAQSAKLFWWVLAKLWRQFCSSLILFLAFKNHKSFYFKKK